MTMTRDFDDDRPRRLRDVSTFLHAATRRRPLTPGTTLLVVTDLEQNILSVRVLRRTASYNNRSRLAYDVMAPIIEKALPPRRRGGPPTGIGYLIHAREGRVVPVPDDTEWAWTLLWACGFVCCYTGDVVLVTPHGWRVGDTAGWSPTLTELSVRSLRSVPASVEAS